MLGGIPRIAPQLSRIDIQSSRTFLARLGIGQRRGRTKVARALEPGAGIGRVTLGLLVDVADAVDVVEPIARFTEGLVGREGVARVLNVGMDEWRAEMGREDEVDVDDNKRLYDLVWIQLCVGQLTDKQLTGFLERCREALKPGGYICIKDNVCRSVCDMFDETDSSVTR